MPSLNVARTRDLLHSFDFRRIFIEELGWSVPVTSQPAQMEKDGAVFERRQIAELSGVSVFEVIGQNGAFPDSRMRAAIHREISQLHHENLLIFLDRNRTQSLWYWVKREDSRTFPREHYFMRGQPGDLFISKLSGMVFDISRFEQGDVSIVEVADTLKKALDVERVTKRFYTEYDQERLQFTELIQGIPDPAQKRWYASVLLNRMMYIYFLQRKGLIDGGRQDYLQHQLSEVRQRFGPDQYFPRFLKLLFFEGFAKPESERSPEARALLGRIVYLNGGLFLKHPVEMANPDIRIPDRAFQNLLRLFERYSWNLDDTPGGKDDEINPDVLGYIFEKYINQKAFGAYYTRPEITEYLCEHTIHEVILDRMNPVDTSELGLPKPKTWDSLADLLLDLDAGLCKRLLFDVLPSLSILDPACGSGAFLVAAMKTLINVYSAATGKIEYLGNHELSEWLARTRAEHRSLAYYIKRTIITNNLFGVDIMEEACEIAKLRLFLALVSSAQSVDQLEPLPNIDFNILAGNSLIGLLSVDEHEFRQSQASQGSLNFDRSYRELLDEKNRLVHTYRSATGYREELGEVRDRIVAVKDEARATLDRMLLEEFIRLGIRFEQATWDEAKGREGKPVKRPLTLEDIRELKPFHWGYEFDEVLNGNGGFDVIITNPPWEVFQTDEKEFFQRYEETIQKKKLRIEDWKQQFRAFMGETEIRESWLAYASGFPHVTAYFKGSAQYANQRSVVNERNVGSKINLYTLFTEQCASLLRPGGDVGIVIPSGIYTDLGAKQLREMLFSGGTVSGLFGFENRRAIFEGVHRSYKFVVLTWRKGGRTERFPAAFMRHDVQDLAAFPQQGAIEIPVELVRRLSPDSLSIMEFKCALDVQIAEKMLRFPLLGEDVPGKWKLSLSQELNMTTDSHLFLTEPGPGRLPLFEGKMIHQFTHTFAEPRYWVDEAEGRKAVLGRTPDRGQTMDYQCYRLGFRDIAANTNERTLLSTVIPPAFHGNKLPTVRVCDDGRFPSSCEQLCLCAIWNSFLMDWMIRQKVTTTLNFFYIYQLPVPRLTEADAEFGPIVERAARLVCTAPEFDDLAREVGLRGHQDGATDPAERAKLRAELDAIVAHLYGLTEEEFAHILSTFPLVAQDAKDAAMQEFRRRG